MPRLTVAITVTSAMPYAGLIVDDVIRPRKHVLDPLDGAHGDRLGTVERDVRGGGSMSVSCSGVTRRAIRG